MSPSERFLRRRRRIRIAWGLVLGSAALVRIADWDYGRDVDDWQTFNHRTFVVASATDDGSILVRSVDGSTQQIVRLLGMTMASQIDLQTRLIGRSVTLLLDSPQTRDAQRHLLAYVFTSETDNLNVELVRDGLAYADRQQDCLFEQEIRAAQSDAKRKSHVGATRSQRTRPDSQPAFAG
jgi:Staphylococcal nuclease homologue